MAFMVCDSIKLLRHCYRLFRIWNNISKNDLMQIFSVIAEQNPHYLDYSKDILMLDVLINVINWSSLWYRWCLAVKNNFFAYFADRYLLSITMIFGATIGGMTSEGGGAVAFPVMTLALGIKPSVARDFSLMIQSCGKYIQSNTRKMEIW